MMNVRVIIYFVWNVNLLYALIELDKIRPILHRLCATHIFICITYFRKIGFPFHPSCGGHTVYVSIYRRKDVMAITKQPFWLNHLRIRTMVVIELSLHLSLLLQILHRFQFFDLHLSTLNTNRLIITWIAGCLQKIIWPFVWFYFG